MTSKLAADTQQKTENPWDTARRRLLRRTNSHARFLAERDGRGGSPNPEPIDREVNFFLLQLERLGLTTEWSCAGHPSGFYLTFNASYAQALVIRSYGYFSVELEGLNYFSLRFSYRHKSSRERNRTLRWAANAWVRAFGPLDAPPPSWAELLARLLAPGEEAAGEAAPGKSEGTSE